MRQNVFHVDVEVKSINNEPHAICVLLARTRRIMATVKPVRSIKCLWQQEHVNVFLVAQEPSRMQQTLRVCCVLQESSPQRMEPVRHVM